MSNHFYSSDPGYREQSPMRSRPADGYDTMQTTYPRASSITAESFTAPQSRSVPHAYDTAAAPPLPPQHWTNPSSPGRYDQPQYQEYHHDDPYAHPGRTDYAHDRSAHALQGIDNLYGGGRMAMTPSPEFDERSYDDHDNLNAPARPVNHPSYSQGSIAPLVADSRDLQRHSVSPHRSYQDDTGAMRSGYPIPQSHQHQGDGYDAGIDLQNLADDDDDDGFGRSHRGTGTRAAGSAGLGSGVMLSNLGQRDASGSYNQLPSGGRDAEKSEWLRKQTGGSKTRWKKFLFIGVGLLVLVGIAAGVVAGILSNKKTDDRKSKPASSSANSGNLYDINSAEVKKLLNDGALHKVFPAMDYTPLNAQYPDCLSNPPDQNNVTLDITMLAQLAPSVRLYGTDCAQTEMVLTAIDRLGYNDTMKVWIGVWLGSNDTTNTRQLDQMYDVLKLYPSTHFAGVIVGNEVLFRKDLTEAELATQLRNVRTNLTSMSIDLPVATSDLGDNWTTELASDSDIVLANIHPFFAGTLPEDASAWTWNFWQSHDVILTSAAPQTATYPKHIISEVGWPSAGGNDCGTGEACPNDTAGSVASIPDMNTFMDGWVCQSLANGTTYFWFEAFDEPWKVIFNTENDNWESKWGLMDSNRQLKQGIEIPSCGGKTIDKPY